MKLLIAEDEPSLRENLLWMLELEGYTVCVARDGQEAYAMALQELPDLVLTDVMMPNLDGYGLIKALRANSSTATVPIVMLTAKADRSDVRTGMNLGADDYLTKPYRREELLDAVRARLARSEGLEQAAQRLQDKAIEAQQRDALTSLPSRTLFGKLLETRLAACSQSAQPLAVVCLGLDGFSKINDSLGAVVGDQVLCEVAQRLNHYMQMQGAEPDCVARLGSDLFALQISATPTLSALERQSARLLALLAQPFEIDGQTLFLTSCAGASLFPLQAQSANPLLRNAESALHHAKSGGPGTSVVFDSAMNQQVARRLQINNDLHRAMALGELQVFYQPQVRIATGQLVGFEALMRWKHSSMGWISPAEFIPVAEESGVIVKLGEWVMRTAAAQAAQWLADGHSNFRMAVNMSVRQFAANNLPELVASVLQDTQLPPHMLELEVTESLALHSVAATLGTLHACKALGVQLAMDDFGTGYSSLAYLKRYPLDSLKIDQAFVRNITRDAGDAAITRAIVAMAHSFGMSVIAEGVETADQLEFLRQLGCEDFQGYLFSKPVNASEAEKCFGGYHQIHPQLGFTI